MQFETCSKSVTTCNRLVNVIILVIADLLQLQLVRFWLCSSHLTLLFQVSAPNWAGYLTSMGVTQTGVYTNDWTPVDGNPPGKAEHLPPISGRGRPQTLFSAVKEQFPTAKVRSFIWQLSTFISVPFTFSIRLYWIALSVLNCSS